MSPIVGQYEDENPTGKWSRMIDEANAESTAGYDRQQATADRHFREFADKSKQNVTTTREHFTVVYFMPDGNAILRYEKSEGIGSAYYGRNAFAVAKVIPGHNPDGPKLEWLKFRGDLTQMMTDITSVYMEGN